MIRVLAAAFVLCLCWQPLAAQSIKIGLALSPHGVTATEFQQMRDGFDLALEQAGHRLGRFGVALTTVPPGDRSNELARLEAFLKQEKPDVLFLTGPEADNMALLKAINDAGVVVIKPGVGGMELAGKRCLPNVFVSGYQADQALDAIAEFIDSGTQKRVILASAQSFAGSTEVLRRAIKTEILRQVALDDKAASYEPDVARIVADKPQAILLHAPVGIAARFLTALRAAPGGADIAVISAAAGDESMLSLLGEAALGLLAPGNWATGLDNLANTEFVSAFRQATGHAPSSAAVYAYDAVRLLKAGLEKLPEKFEVVPLREAMRATVLESPRGSLNFSNNNFPIQDFYIKRIETKDGAFLSVPAKKVFAQFGDDYAAECPLR